MNPALLFQIVVVIVLIVAIAAVAVLTGFIVGKRGGDGKNWRNRTGTALLAILSAFFLWIYFVNPLPSDEVMIKHFNTHRGVYEELATGFIHAIKGGNDTTKVWMASPHTLELKKSIKAKDERDKLEKDQWFEGIRANVDLPGYEDKGSIEFWVEDGFKFSWREMNSMWKIYIYFPEIKPETEGRLQCPAGSGRKCLGNLFAPLVDSLDGYPSFEQGRRRNCGTLMRKIDEHWYIAMVRAC